MNTRFMLITNVRATWLLTLALLLPLTASAAGKLQVSDAWIRVAPPGATVLAGYATLKNIGDAPITITGVSSNAFAMSMIHETVISNGVASMRELPRIDIAPGATFTLKPGAGHLMLMQPKHAIALGDEVWVMFNTSKGKAVSVKFSVRSP